MLNEKKNGVLGVKTFLFSVFFSNNPITKKKKRHPIHSLFPLRNISSQQKKGLFFRYKGDVGEKFFFIFGSIQVLKKEK